MAFDGTQTSSGISAGYRAAAAQHVRVVYALMLRDLQTRVGASYFGFLLSLLFPLAHIAVLLSIYILLGRRAPIGTDVMLYLATAILPFVLWSYTHRHMMQGFSQNKPLTAFPIVRFHDIFVARALVELVLSMLIVVVFASTLALLDKDLFVAFPQPFLYALVLAYALGVGSGLFFGLMSLAIPGFNIVGFIIIPFYWVTSGIFFIPDVLPEPLRVVVMVFPLAHVVDFGRVSFYASYVSNFYSLIYVHVAIGAFLLAGLLVERLLRPTLTEK